MQSNGTDSGDIIVNAVKRASLDMRKFNCNSRVKAGDTKSVEILLVFKTSLWATAGKRDNLKFGEDGGKVSSPEKNQ